MNHNQAQNALRELCVTQTALFKGINQECPNLLPEDHLSAEFSANYLPQTWQEVSSNPKDLVLPFQVYLVYFDSARRLALQEWDWTTPALGHSGNCLLICA